MIEIAPLIASTESLISDLNYRIANADAGDDTAWLRALVRQQKDLLHRLTWARVAFATNPKEPLL